MYTDSSRQFWYMLSERQESAKNFKSEAGKSARPGDK